MHIRDIFQLISETGKNFGRHNSASYAAAIAYHTIISLAPILLFAIAVAGRAFETDAATQHIVSTLDRLVGTAVASIVAEIVEENSLRRTSNVVISLIALGIMFYSASNVFRQLVIALNVIWDIPIPSVRIRDGVIRWVTIRLRKYIMGFILALAVIFSLLISLVVNVFAGYFADLVNSAMPGLADLLLLINLTALPIILVFFCLAIFKFLPDTTIVWRDIRLGAFLTGIVLAIGQSGIGFYASRSRIPDLYGVAGSVVILMLWAYFSAYILLLGAEFTHIYARMYGSYSLKDQ
ncbi:YihY/virulence factor BrkB family protein [Chloroflexi bacterium TSY]|nr:YihY/virulence factor BrkB family protein [Chloroflexi bacterium TSY]